VHLTPWEILPLIVLGVVWLLPDWLLKLMVVAEAIRRYRSRLDEDATDER
jgi:hypothetical protein